MSLRSQNGFSISYAFASLHSENGYHTGVRANCTFNADANTGHSFGIFMACVGTLRASRCGAG